MKGSKRLPEFREIGPERTKLLRYPREFSGERIRDVKPVYSGIWSYADEAEAVAAVEMDPAWEPNGPTIEQILAVLPGKVSTGTIPNNGTRPWWASTDAYPQPPSSLFGSQGNPDYRYTRSYGSTERGALLALLVNHQKYLRNLAEWKARHAGE